MNNLRKYQCKMNRVLKVYVVVLIDFWLTVKAVFLMFIYGRGSVISSANQGKLGYTRIYDLVKNR